MKTKFDKVDLVVLIILIAAIAYFTSSPVSAHETPVEKAQVKIVSKATEDNNDKLILLTRQIEALTKQLAAVEVRQNIKPQPKPIVKIKPKAKPKPIKVPKYKLKQLPER